MDGKIAIFSLKHTQAHTDTVTCYVCIFSGFWCISCYGLGLRSIDYTEICVTKCKILY